ncbi:monocarboxylate transporter [Colletotrichum truncatum]|uniref:Monocarboxylate transporter n=1 Tax=Colletotrichum truncatum TaxID=5467 RepID=A0ACC3Z6H2_COLTU|nr:monocarboxylate transporter [Colletotrichum truncatum]KAF6788073.1 monocarboxylate transporter [Colletotrichum truncatum]
MSLGVGFNLYHDPEGKTERFPTSIPGKLQHLKSISLSVDDDTPIMSAELTTFNTNRTARAEESDREATESLVQTLAPPDRGIAAWKFLFSAFVVEALLWGFPLAYGVFQEYYSTHPDFEGNTGNIAVVGTLATSIYFIGAPFVTPVVKRYQRWQTHMIGVGSILCVVALVAASFATSVSGLVATQGVMYGVGFTMLYFPVLRMLNEWFIERRGMAYGIMFAGGGFSGVGFPFLLEVLLSKYGHKTTLRAVAVGIAISTLPLLPLLKGRLPVAHGGALRALDVSFFKQPLFYIFALSNLFQGLGYYIPSIYLPTYASSLGLSGTTGALILALFNLSTTFGQLAMGWLSDRTSNALLLVFLSSFPSALAAFLLWGFASSLPTLMAFSIIYGWFAGSFVILWPKFGGILSDDPGAVYSMMAFGKGVGNLLTGPISVPLMSGPVQSGYGLNRFEPLILYLGSMMLVSSLGIVGWPVRVRPN